MTQPIIQFIETMRGQVMLAETAIPQEQTTATGFAPPEDRTFVERRMTGTSQAKAPMAWRDLVVRVATTARSAENGMVGTIDQGVIEVAGLDEGPLTLEQGHFDLLPSIEPGMHRMRYQLHCHMGSQASEATLGTKRHFTLYGFKDVTLRAGQMRLWALWQDTTTLFVTIYEHGPNAVPDFLHEAEHGAMEDELIIGTGIIHIHALDFAKQLLTFRSSGVNHLVGHITNFVRFFQFFTGTLLGVYFGKRRAATPSTLTERTGNSILGRG